MSNSPLVALADEINACFAKTDDLRILAGKNLLEAKGLVEAGEAGRTTWKAWLAENIKRSERDCRKIMSIAASPDPAAALKKEQEKAREAMAASRARSATKRANVSPEELPVMSSDVERMRCAEIQAKALRETLVAITEHDKRAQALDLVDKCLEDVREDIRRREGALIH